jgi:hypothetical protein
MAQSQFQLLEGTKALAFPIVYSFLIMGLMFVPCFHGSNIESQSEKFIFDLFSSEWYDFDLKCRKMVVVMMENLKKPMSVKAFGFGAINLDFFLQVSCRNKVLKS